MNVTDWRTASVDVLRPVYERGRQGWLRDLGWETSGALREVEHARTTWGLPGFLASDDAGHVRGWTFYFPEDNVFHVGGLTADTPSATSALLDALVDTAEANAAAGVSCFIYEEATGVGPELTRRGFDVEPFLYLSREVAPARHTGSRSGRDPRLATTAEEWRPDDVGGAAALMRAAYGPVAGRHFAPRDTPAEWDRYLRNLVTHTACGELNAEATRVIRRGGVMEALVLVTTLSQDTVHLPQVVVHESRRGEGLAAALIEHACAIAAGQGFNRATLLVGATNHAARRLYDRIGFTHRATFVAARRELRA